MPIIIILAIAYVVFVTGEIVTGGKQTCDTVLIEYCVTFAVALISFVLWFLFLRKTHCPNGHRWSYYYDIPGCVNGDCKYSGVMDRCF